MNYIVTSSADTGTGTLRAAITLANSNPGSTITFDYPSVTSVTLDSSITITAAMTIDGPGVTITQTGNDRIFNIENSTGTTVTINGSLASSAQPSGPLILTGGNPSSGGGAIFVKSGTSVLSYCNITENKCSNGGGGGISINSNAIANISYCNITDNIEVSSGGGGGGGIFVGGTANMSYCNITGNSNTAGGGGILSVVGATVNISYCNITGNSSTDGGGIIVNGTSFITNSNISQNTASSTTGGGGLRVNSRSDTVVMFDDLVYNNTALFNTGILVESGILYIFNSTISSNIATNKNGGIINSGGTINIGNTIVYGNTGGTDPDVYGAFASQGYNLIGNATGSTGFIASDIIGVNPLLGTYTNNGGPTNSQILQPGSPAINAGSNTVLTNFATMYPTIVTTWDQRGTGFPRIVDGTVDIGSTEYQYVCYAGDSVVLVKFAVTGETTEIKASDVMPDTHLVYDTAANQFVPVKLNIVMGPATRFIMIPKNSLGENKPSTDFYVTSGHKIVIDSVETKAKHIHKRKKVYTKPQMVYSICTENRAPIRINNLDVMAYGYEEWIDYASKRGLSWSGNRQHLLNI